MGGKKKGVGVFGRMLGIGWVASEWGGGGGGKENAASSKGKSHELDFDL
jgi:hypothetical protein